MEFTDTRYDEKLRKDVNSFREELDDQIHHYNTYLKKSSAEHDRDREILKRLENITKAHDSPITKRKIGALKTIESEDILNMNLIGSSTFMYFCMIKFIDRMISYLEGVTEEYLKESETTIQDLSNLAADNINTLKSLVCIGNQSYDEWFNTSSIIYKSELIRRGRIDPIPVQ